MNKGEKRRELLAFAAVILLIAAAAAGLALHDYVSASSSFPLWKEPETLPQAEEKDRLTVTNVYDMSQPCGEGLAWDELTLCLQRPGAGIVYYTGPVIVDYSWGGRWHTVYEGDADYCIYAPRGEAVRTAFRFPSGLFHRDGRYRVKLAVRTRSGEAIEICSYEFTSKHRGGPVEGMGANDFPSWQRLEEEDEVSEDITLTAEGITVDGGRTMLEYRWVNRGEPCGSHNEYRVDRLWQGDWYTVSAARALRGTDMGDPMTPGEHTDAVKIPSQIPEHPGGYRIYWYGTGYCEFTVE